VDAEREASENEFLLDLDHVALALAQLNSVMESLEDGDPRKWGQSDPWQQDRDFRNWKADVYWMFYQQDPLCEEHFSLESCCSYVASALRMPSLTADAVRESCFRQGLCPPESKVVRKRCKRARIVVLSH